jgi:hypothetical protein
MKAPTNNNHERGRGVAAYWLVDRMLARLPATERRAIIRAAIAALDAASRRPPVTVRRLLVDMLKG